MKTLLAAMLLFFGSAHAQDFEIKYYVSKKDGYSKFGLQQAHNYSFEITGTEIRLDKNGRVITYDINGTKGDDDDNIFTATRGGKDYIIQIKVDPDRELGTTGSLLIYDEEELSVDVYFF